MIISLIVNRSSIESTVKQPYVDHVSLRYTNQKICGLDLFNIGQNMAAKSFVGVALFGASLYRGNVLKVT